MTNGCKIYFSDRDYSSVEKAEGPYHEKLQRHHQFTDTKYKHNVTIPESLRYSHT